MGGEDGAEPDKELLRARALALRGLAADTRVFTGTAAECELERIRAEVAEALHTIEGADPPYWAIADRLQVLANRLENLLFMSAINAPTGRPVRELREKLTRWREGD